MKKFITILLTMLMCLSLAACGSKPEENVVKEKTDLEYIQEKGTLIVGITDFEPMDFEDSTGKWVGFDAQLAELVAEKLGVKVVFQLINWGAKETELAGKTIDCIWNGLTWDETRAENMSLTDWYMENVQSFVIRSGEESKFTSQENLTGVSVAAEAGSAGEDYVKDALTTATYIEKDYQIDALVELKMGTVDAAVIDNVMAFYLINKEGSDFSNLKVLDNFITPEKEYYSVAFRKGSDVTATVNDILKQFVSDGTMENLAKQYGLTEALVK